LRASGLRWYICKHAIGEKRMPPMIVEMRTYQLKPGMRDAFMHVFRSRMIPKHDEIGLKVSGPFLSVEDPDVLFFMRGYPDIASRTTMNAELYGGELWKNELEAIVMPMIDTYQVIVVADPERLISWNL
jgi:hypothetical protein